MPSITSWTRLETRTRSQDLRTTIQAKIHDPLWMLARQWQLGEFQGEDGGSPVQARARLRCSPISRFYPGSVNATSDIDAEAYDALTVPLETRVEGESHILEQDARPDWRLAAEIGLQFVTMLTESGLSEYRSDYLQAYALPSPTQMTDSLLSDPDTHAYLSVMAGRAPNGLKLFSDLKAALQNANAELPSDPNISDADQDAIITVAGDWLSWVESLFGAAGPGASAWDAQRMEYTFAVSARDGEGEQVFAASEYQEGHLDWYAFNQMPGAKLGAAQDETSQQVVRTVIPAPVRYRGMPADRWWQFEDAQVFLGGIDTSPEDLSRLIHIEFALSYGNDWFVMPVDVPIGGLCMMQSLVITDTFDIRTLIPAYTELDSPDSGWKMYAVQPDGRNGEAGSSKDGLLLPPVLANSQEGEAIEEVLFLRDEMANMAWAVEKIVAGGTGSPINRFEAQLRRSPLDAASAESPGKENTDILKYHLNTNVPDNWLPLVPVKLDPGKPAIRLQRGRMMQNDSSAPFGEILKPGEILSLYEEEVPKAGARVTRSFQSARWQNGSTHVWIGRRKQAGKGQGWSGLRFDVVE